MSGGNAKTYAWYRAQFTDKTTRVTVAAADSATKTDVLKVKSANHVIYVQRIFFNVTTDAAQTLTFQDDNGTPKVIAATAASPGVGLLLVADFGAEGIPLTVGKNLDIVLSAAGLAGQITIEAYEKLGAAVSANAGASAQ